MSSWQSDARTQAEFFTSTHRLTGKVETGPKPLSDLLNDQINSYLLLFDVYVSRLDDPAVIGAHAATAYLAKQNISFVIVPLREIRTSERSRFATKEQEVLITLPGFEVWGRFSGPLRSDLRTFAPSALESFVVLTQATARLTGAGMEKEGFWGEAILVNRAQLQSFCLME
jgi:hypothetical protein